MQRLGARGAAQRGATTRGGQRGAAPTGRGTAPVRGGSAFRGGGGGRSGRPSIDKNVYVHLLAHLRKKALLPVVVFTLSKKRCEENAATLTNADLCTSVEKSEVHVAVEKALSRLKGMRYIPKDFNTFSNAVLLGSDKHLPQIGRMRDLLSRGIGVHHGGLLPIVKEVQCC